MGKFVRYKDLVMRLALSSFKLRNEGSYLGVAWYLLNPLIMFVILFFIFKNRMGQDIEFYPLYLLFGLIQWNFMANSIKSSMRNILDNERLIKSINFDRPALVLSSLVMSLIVHFFELIMFLLFLFVIGSLNWHIVLFPIVLLILTLFIVGMAYLFSALIIFMRDLENIWEFVAKLWWFATPIFYSIEPGTLLYSLNQFNPMYHFIDISRGLLIYGQLPSLFQVLLILIFSISSYLIGSTFFIKYHRKFAELI